jgi:hypothetical protein
MTMPIDKLEMRCPRLGGPVNFGYCRHCGENDRPCFKILDCWWQRFDVVGHLKSRLPREEFEALGQHPPEKITSLLDLIAQAQKNTGSR